MATLGMKGTKFYIAFNDTDYTEIVGVENLSATLGSWEHYEHVPLATGTKEKKPTVYDAGQVTFTLATNFAHASHESLVDMFLAGATHPCRVEFADDTLFNIDSCFVQTFPFAGGAATDYSKSDVVLECSGVTEVA